MDSNKATDNNPRVTVASQYSMRLVRNDLADESCLAVNSSRWDILRAVSRCMYSRDDRGVVVWVQEVVYSVCDAILLRELKSWG